MSVFYAILLFIIGIVLIVKGGDWFVDAAAWIARVSGIPKVIIGATIVSLATTLPEIIVSLIAAFEGNCGIAVGNAVGSVTSNMGLILSILAIFSPFAIRRKDYAVKGGLMIAGIIILYISSIGGSLSRVGALLLFTVFAVFMFENLSSARGKKQFSENGEKTDKMTVSVNILKFAAGTAGIVIGADLLVDNGEFLAGAAGVSDAVIGATVIAVGTSLPELATTITAVVKKQGAISAGNIIGANVIDATLIVPLCNIVSKGNLDIKPQNYMLDMPACLVIAAVAVIPMIYKSKLMRWQGIAMLSIYVLYIVLLLIYFM